MIWLIAGTHEAKEMVNSLKDTKNLIISVTTDYAKTLLRAENIIVAKLEKDQMQELCIKNNIKMIVDMSHPFAQVVTQNAREVSSKLNIKFIRYKRPGRLEESAIYASDLEEAKEIISSLEGTFFFTTGSKNIKDFEEIRGEKRFIYRILPLKNSLELAEKENVGLEDLVLMKGPFSLNINKAFIENYKADYIVLKESGRESGMEEKLQAAKECGIKAIVIRKEEEKGLEDLKEIKRFIEDEISSKH